MSTALMALLAPAGAATTLLAVAWVARAFRATQQARQDMEERDEEERAFREKLLDSMHDAVIGVDPALRVRRWNRAAEQLYGWTAAEAIGCHVREVLRTEYPDGEEGRRRQFERIAAKGRIQTHLVQHRRDGTRIEIDGVSAALRGPDGAITGYLLANRDVTERMRAEAALRASEAKFRAAFHGANVGFLLIDRDGRILEFNRAFRVMLGHDLDEVKRARIDELAHPDDVPGCREEVLDLLQGYRDSAAGEIRCRRKDGSYAQAFVRASAVRDPAGALLYCIVVVEDVTEKKAMQAQLLFADRMASMGTLAAGVAHEINNPLAFIIANVSFVSEELARVAPDHPELLQPLEETLQGAERVREIVRDLKTFSRPDEPGDQPVDVRDVLRSSVNMVQNEIRHRARVAMDLREVPPVAASANRLGQVFVNLLINAAHAMSEGSAEGNEVRVSCRLADDGRVAIEVADTGCGIPPHVLPRIFEPFFTTKPVGEGTGLGLAICHGIVSGLGGQISVESQGRGATFRVLLPPATLPAAAEDPRAAGAQASGRRGRLVVIDDDAPVARSLARVLSDSHEVITYTSAREALAGLERDTRFDVVFCDLMMPELTGMELHARLVRSAPELARRMVFVTGGAFTRGAREFLAGIPNIWFEKPFDPVAVRQLVDELVGRA